MRLWLVLLVWWGIRSFSSQVLAAPSQLITTTMTHDQRLKVLGPYFKPSFGAEVAVAPEEVRERSRAASIQSLRGYIQVAPPPHQCFTITTALTRADLRICKPQRVPFALGDLNSRNQISWWVRTDSEDAGTPVHWQTPYSLGRLVDPGMPWPGGARDVVIAACRAEIATTHITVSLDFFSDSTWTLRIPRQAQTGLSPTTPKPNLFIQASEDEASYKTLKKPQADPVSPTTTPPTTPNQITSDWQLHPRDSYRLPKSSLFLGDNNLQSPQSECRYKFYGYDSDPNIPVLECHNLGSYQWLYMPLKCLVGIK